MPERVNSLAATIFISIFVPLAAVAVDFAGAAWAGDTCIEKPPLPVTEGQPGNVSHNDGMCHSCYYMTEVLLWDVRYDRAKGRTCWFLRDAHGRDVTEAYVRSRAAPTSTSSMWSKFASWFGNFNFMTASAIAAPASNALQINPSDPSRKYQADPANARKADGSVRVGQKSSGEAPAGKRVSQASIHQNDRDERALFEEFLRWRERRKIIDTLTPSSPTRH
jgi:hypothetical protein